MLVSQSNSGSTWFSRCIAEACPDLIFYRKEFFNPILNHRHQKALAKVFGCELYQCVPNLAARQPQDTVACVIDKTWGVEPYTFTKENYLGFHLAHFANRFDLLGIVCDIGNCFPPARLRVMQWYDNWLHSIVLNGRLEVGAACWVRDVVETAEARALVGWQVYRWVLEEQFSRLRIPSYRYEHLMRLDKPALVSMFDAIGLPQQIDARALASQVVATRKPEGPALEHARQWREAFEIHSDFVRLFQGPQRTFIRQTL